MITLPSKPELVRFARGRDVDRLGYAHTLAHHFARLAIYYNAKADSARRVFGDRSKLREQYYRASSEAWRRYDRCTRFLYENTKM